MLECAKRGLQGEHRQKRSRNCSAGRAMDNVEDCPNRHGPGNTVTRCGHRPASVDDRKSRVIELRFFGAACRRRVRRCDRDRCSGGGERDSRRAKRNALRDSSQVAVSAGEPRDALDSRSTRRRPTAGEGFGGERGISNPRHAFRFRNTQGFDCRARHICHGSPPEAHHLAGHCTHVSPISSMIKSRDTSPRSSPVSCRISFNDVASPLI